MTASLAPCAGQCFARMTRPSRVNTSAGTCARHSGQRLTVDLSGRPTSFAITRAMVRSSSSVTSSRESAAITLARVGGADSVIRLRFGFLVEVSSILPLHQEHAEAIQDPVRERRAAIRAALLFAKEAPHLQA